MKKAEAGQWTWKDSADQWLIQKNVDIKGTAYNVYNILYQTVLKPGDTTATPAMTKVYMDPHVDIDTNGDWYHVEKGVVTGPYWNTKDDGNPIIYVSAYAMQEDGFANVYEAFEAYNGQWTTAEGENTGLEWGTPATIVTASDKTEMKTAVANAIATGATEIVVDAEGANIGDLNYGLNKAMVPEGTTLTIANAVVEGKSYGNAVDGTVVFTNCTFTNTGAYSIHFDAGKGNVIFNDCRLEGWCSFGSAISAVEMNGCTIVGNGTYALNRFYQNAVLNNCVIDCQNANTADAYPDGISAVGDVTVELNGCTIIDCGYEAAEMAKIVVDGVTVLESTSDKAVYA